MINIPNYTYVTHRIIARPWGIECNFTVRDITGNDINDTITVTSAVVDESEIAELITTRLQSITTLQSEPIPPVATIAVSNIDAGLIEAKERLKGFGIIQIKTNPLISEGDYFAAFDSAFDVPDAFVARKLLSLYIEGSFSQGFISEPTFNAFRDFVVATPVEILMGI